MDDPRWLRLVTIGLVLAAMAVGYFLIAGKFSANKSAKPQTQVTKTVEQTPQPTPSPTVLGQDTSSSSGAKSAYDRIAERTQGQVQTLPKTGFPLGLLAVISISTIISGLGLRKFPK